MFTSLTDGYILNSGVKIPCVGFGTWKTPDGEVAAESVRLALEAGYRHIDTAAIYGNEEGVGQGIARGNVPRDQLFVTTKLWNAEHGYESTLKAFEASCKRLKLDYIDLYLIHWPNPVSFRDCWAEKNAETWRAFEKLYEEGLVRAIGVSNFYERHLQALEQTQRIAPMVNQMKLCPGITEPNLAAYCRARGMVMEAYSPLGGGTAFTSPALTGMAEKYGVSVARLVLRWCLQAGFVPLPKSVTPERIKDNADLFSFEIDEADCAVIAALADVGGAPANPDTTNF